MRSTRSARHLGVMVLIRFVVLGPQIAFAADVVDTVSIPPGEEDNFGVAEFYLRIPQTVTNPRCILVLLPGINGNGSRLVDNELWLRFAEETRAAIVACTFKMRKSKTRRYRHYAAAQHGSGAALESAIARFDEARPGRSLAELPLLIHGHSAGGQFAFGFTCHNPKRVLGFAGGKGGYYFPDPVDGTFEVPGLMVSGMRDSSRRRTAIRSLFEGFREKGAPWCWVQDRGSHGGKQYVSVVVAYFRELARQQLQKKPGRPYGIHRGGLVGVGVNLRTKKAADESTPAAAAGTDPQHGWLPSRDVFEVWARVDVGMAKYAGRDESAGRK